MSAAHLALFLINYWIHIQFFLLSLAEPSHLFRRALPGKHSAPSTLGLHLLVSNTAHQVPCLNVLQWHNNTSQEVIRKWHRWAEPCRWKVSVKTPYMINKEKRLHEQQEQKGPFIWQTAANLLFCCFAYSSAQSVCIGLYWTTPHTTALQIKTV